MKPCKYVLPLAIASLLATACASVPSDPDSQAKLAASLGPIQVDQEGDGQLSCGDLSSQIHQVQWDISALDLQINRAQNASIGFGIFRAIETAAGAVANTPTQANNAAVGQIVGDTGQAISNTVGLTKAQIRGTYQARYDNLVGIFNGKGCPPST